MDEPNLAWEDAVIVGRDDVLECNEGNIIPQEQGIISKLRGWLRPTNFDGEGSEYRKHLSSRIPGTGDWFLTSDTYQEWHDGAEHGLLWVRGIPGSGKSVLAATIIDELQQESVPVLYFFFRQILDANYTPRAALQDWLAQALMYSPPLQLQLRSYLGNTREWWRTSNASRELDSLSIDDLWQHLRTALSQFTRVYIVADALDEMDYGQDAEAFLYRLSNLAQWRPSQVKILMTSRLLASVEHALRNEKMLRSRLQEDDINLDISTYVHAKLSDSTISPELHGLIQAAIPGRAKGLFLYAKLAMDAFLRNDADIHKVLRKLPDNLHQTYLQLLQEHTSRTGSSMDTQLLMMQWITHSVRPLRLIEMSDMFTKELDFQNRDLLVAKRFVRSACGPLLELLPDETICAVHHSFTEFLNGATRSNADEYPILYPGSTHNRLATVCLSYLQTGCLDDAVPKPSSSRHLFGANPKKPSLAPFTKYAALHWHIHVKKASAHGIDQTKVNMMIDEFAAHPSFQGWTHLAGLHSETSDAITPLSLAVLLGLSSYLKHLISRPGTDCNEGAPIIWAADRGFADVVDLLIRNGADVERYNNQGFTALHRGAIKNHPKVVRLLLDAGGDMNRLTKIESIDCGFPTTQHSALSYACGHGHHAIVTEFQKHMRLSQEVDTALSFAVKNKRANVVEQLLKHPLVDLNEDREGPLMISACKNRDLDTIKLLLAAGACVNGYALHALARSKEETDLDSAMQCFRVIIEAGADVHLRDPGDYYNTPLHRAADLVAVKMLLEAGANTEAENKGKETPLHTCSEVTVLNMLVKSGKANLEKLNYQGETPLLAAMGNKSILAKDIHAIQALISLGANVNAVNREGNGVFHLALKRYYGDLPEGLISRLCAAGADINRANNRDEAPIFYTKIEFGKASIGIPKRSSRFEVMVAAGAELVPNTANVSRTPLFEWMSRSLFGSSEQNLPDVLEVLSKCRASLQFTDDRGRTLLHDAVKSSIGKAHLQFLLEQGLDPQKTDNEGNTIWHEAALNLAGSVYNLTDGPPGPFDHLLRIGLSPIVPNHNGRTPLHVLSSLWPSSVYYFQRSCSSGIGSGHLNHTTAFNVVLSLYPNVNIADKDGITPLHLASTFSEYLVRNLLDKDADPSLGTNEGCNAFHLSARSRMPNIVGMLIEALKLRTNTAHESVINAKDHLGRTPLYYACLAGSYESVKALIGAGAVVNSTYYESSPWRGLAGHEAEIDNWADHSPDKHAGGVLIDDKRRPTGQNGRYRQDRLEELIALLMTNESSGSTILDRTIADAAERKADYTVECLLRARSSTQPTERLVHTTQINESIERRQTKRADLERPCEKCELKHTKTPLQRARIMNDYHLIPEILLEDGRTHTYPENDEEKAILRDIVRNGFASTLQGLLDYGGLWTLDERRWKATLSSSRSGGFGMQSGQQESETLLLSACRRDISNMDIFRVLIESAGHDINAQNPVKRQTELQYQGFHDFGRPVEGESAIHALVRGEHHWQVNEGLCYLLEHGADTELRDFHGMTPLSAALHRCGWLIFNKRVVEVLIEYGADVNAVDLSGHSCLAKACSDMEMTALLLDRGAVVSRDALIQAIKLNNPELLAILLSRGADPNLRGRCSPSIFGAYTKVSSEEYYPLHHLLSSTGVSWHRLKTTSDQHKNECMIRLLLEHGADPCAKYADSTILHELVLNNEDINVLFNAPKLSLNLEVRNASGQTPLLLACLRTSSPDKTQKNNAEGRSTIGLLIHHGADFRTQDYDGNNMLHLLARNSGFGSDFDEITRIVHEAPELINQPNNEGTTPFHIAMDRGFLPRMITLFFDNGGDVHAVDGNRNTMLHLLLRGDWKIGEGGEVKGELLVIFDRLLALGVNINASNKLGETPIYDFFRHGTVTSEGHSVRFPGSLEQPLLELFTKTRVDWKVLNAKGQNLLHVVASTKRAGTSLFGQRTSVSCLCERFKALVDLGLDAGLEDAAGRTSVDVAADMWHTELLDLFRE